MATLTVVQAVNQALKEEMERDQDVVVLGDDVGTSGGVFRATEGLAAAFGEERCLDTPLSEAAVIGTALGMAMYGMRPVATWQKQIAKLGGVITIWDAMICGLDRKFCIGFGRNQLTSHTRRRSAQMIDTHRIARRNPEPRRLPRFGGV